MEAAVGAAEAQNYWAMAALAILGGKPAVELARGHIRDLVDFTAQYLVSPPSDHQVISSALVRRQVVEPDYIYEGVDDFESSLNATAPSFLFFCEETAQTYTPDAFLSIDGFCELYSACTGNAFDLRFTENHPSGIGIRKFVSLHSVVQAGHKESELDVTVECLFYKARQSGDWRVFLGVPPRPELARFKASLLELLERQSTEWPWCNCDLNFLHTFHPLQTIVYDPSMGHDGALLHIPDFPHSTSPESPYVSGRVYESTPSRYGLGSRYQFRFHGNRALLLFDGTPCIARGTGGNVFRAELVSASGRQTVAVKIPLILPTEDSTLSKEITLWKTLQHDRILPFYGACDLGWGQIGLVAPFMRNGNMVHFLKNNNTANRLDLVLQVAEGMHYLHTSAEIVHGDMKCENVLISDDGHALLADFGLSTVVSSTGDMTATNIRVRHTIAFASPELIQDTAIGGSDILPSIKLRSKTVFSDVYAFGMLVYQAYTGMHPWRGLTFSGIWLNVTAGAIPERPTFKQESDNVSDELWELCKTCWTMEPRSRPRSAAILDRLERLVQ